MQNKPSLFAAYCSGFLPNTQNVSSICFTSQFFAILTIVLCYAVKSENFPWHPIFMVLPFLLN